jgi:Cu/Zn superoxide dismutase
MSLFKAIPAFAGSIALAFVLSAASAAQAKTVKMEAKLDASQEVPPNDSKGKGTAEVTYDTKSKKITWTVEYSDMSGPVTGAHFHGPAKPGESADVAVAIAGDLASPIKGSDTLTAAQAKDLQAGKYYLNLHTAAHADGEIRGWVKKAK